MHVLMQRTLGEIDQAIGGMNDADLDRAPAEGKWAPAQILEHLMMTYTGTTKVLQRCLESGQPSATSPTLKHRVSQLVVTGIGYFPKGRQAPKHVIPKGITGKEAAEQIRSNLVAMDPVITACEQRFGAATKIADHPVMGALTAQQWRRFHFIHAKHHMKQIRAIRAMRGQAAASGKT